MAASALALMKECGAASMASSDQRAWDRVEGSSLLVNSRSREADPCDASRSVWTRESGRHQVAAYDLAAGTVVGQGSFSVSRTGFEQLASFHTTMRLTRLRCWSGSRPPGIIT